MNVLAHVWLAGGDVELEIGGVLGDFVRGRADSAWSPRLRAGVALHRAVDSFTDAHPQVVAARRLFVPPWRRYAGIMLDIWFDHCLARDFAAHTGLALEPFSRRIRERLETAAPHMPERMRRFMRYMALNDLPAAYAEPQMIERVLAGVSGRLSRANPLIDAMPVLQRHEAALQAHFEAFLPELRAFAAKQRDILVAHAS